MKEDRKKSHFSNWKRWQGSRWKKWKLVTIRRCHSMTKRVRREKFLTWRFEGCSLCYLTCVHHIWAVSHEREPHQEMEQLFQHYELQTSQSTSRIPSINIIPSYQIYPPSWQTFDNLHLFKCTQAFKSICEWRINDVSRMCIILSYRAKNKPGDILRIGIISCFFHCQLKHLIWNLVLLLLNTNRTNEFAKI